jgi:long-chain fatty acid transport protein
MKKKWLVLSILFVLVAGLLANGLSLNSPGPRALAMGGAFVGLADDASAIYWNPAALAMQGSSFKAILTDVVPINSYKADGTDYGYPAAAMSFDAKGKKNHYFNPNLFLNYRMNKLALGMGIYIPAGLGSEYEGKDLASFSQNAPGSNDIEWMSKIGVINFSPALAYQIDEYLSFGTAFNIYYGMFELKRLAGVYPYNQQGDVKAFQYSEESDGIGISATFSMMYKMNEKFSTGVTLRLPTKCSMSGEAKNDAMTIAGMQYGLTVPGKSDFDRDVTWPLWLGVGFSYKLCSKTTLTFDAQYSQWSELDYLETKFDDVNWKNFASHHDENLFLLDWEDKTQIRFGIRRMVNDALAIYGGYYYDPAPAPDSRLNILFPSSTNHVATTGFGYTFGKMEIDFGMEYLFGAKRDVKIATKWYDDNSNNQVDSGEVKLMNQPGKHHLDVFAFSLGWGIHF